MEDSITVDTSGLLRQRRQKQRYYPGMGIQNRPETALEDTQDEGERAECKRGEHEGEEVIEMEEPANEAQVVQPGRKVRKRVPRGEGDIQPARKMPVKLRAEAEPEKMVNTILNLNIDGITVREALGLSPDLLRELWEVKRLLARKGGAQVPTIRAEKTLIGIAGARGDIPPTSSRTERVSIEKHLYAGASAMVLGRLEGRRKPKMLIDSGSEMCVM